MSQFTKQEDVISLSNALQSEIEPFMWGREPVTPGMLSEWFVMPGLANQNFEFLYQSDVERMNDLMQAGNEAGKMEFAHNVTKFDNLVGQKQRPAPTTGNPFAKLTMGSRRTNEDSPAATAGAGTRGRGRGRGGKKMSKALVPYNNGGGSVVATGGRFSFH